MSDNKNILISGVGKGIGKDLFYKSVEISNFTIGVVRNYNDFKSINLVMKKKNKKN